MSDVPYFVTLDEAKEISFRTSIPITIESVKLDDAHGRILAHNLESKVNDPPFDNSAMDGFAMRYEDTTGGGKTLEIVGTIQASSQQHMPVVGPGQAVRIMTGARMPEGADSILQIELCDIDGDQVYLKEESKKHFIRKMGENLKIGEAALERGSILNPSKTGLCATMGYEKVPVIKKLKVAIISTGDELVQPGQPLGPGEIYESNSFGLAGLVKWLGHEVLRIQAVDDSLDELRDILNQTSKECDLILTSGGVSMGEWDLVRKIMENEGDIHFWRVKIRPGSPPLFGLWNQTPIFGLPGNPVSSHTVFRMLVAPWIRKTTGASGPKELQIKAKLTTPVKATVDCLTLRRVSVEFSKGEIIAYQKVHQGSGNLASLTSSDALTLLPAGSSAEKGEIIDILLL